LKYISTRGIIKKGEGKSFKQVTLEGLARDGGLYIPYEFPKFSINKIDSMKNMNYAELTAEILCEFTGEDLSKPEIFNIASKAYKNFLVEDAVKIRELGMNRFLLELFHGPTLAFKDFALQLIGGIFDKFLHDDHRKKIIVAATSGDTGSAAIEAFKNKKNVKMFVLHPYGKISEFQRRQMTTVVAENIFNIAIKGNFDDCQALVKTLFKDEEFNKVFDLASINSINWTRVLAQVVYYVYATINIINSSNHTSVNFVVPTGNFGNAYAGYIAKKIGMPIDRLFIATNNNDILSHFFQKGIYKISNVVPTLSPSMDIQVASNFERLLFEILERDYTKVVKFMQSFSIESSLKINDQQLNNVQETFSSFSVSDKETLKIIKDVYDNTKITIDPHTAIGGKAFNFNIVEKNPLVLIATADPVKFREAVEKALGRRYKILKKYEVLFDLRENFIILDNQVSSLKNFIRVS